MGGSRLAAVALGSNLGDRAAHLAFARDRLHSLLGSLRVSSTIETEPVGVLGPQPPFLNAAAVGETTLSAADLIAALLAIEAERGRARPAPNAARTLDLDLILLADAVVDEPGVCVPHPRFRERRFVLEPLVEIGGELRDPVTGKTMRELLALLPLGGQTL